MNDVAARFGRRIEYRPDRAGDVKHIVQDPAPAREHIGFTAGISFEDGMNAYLEDL
jgi:nucleoside-diphosphate-sugar epimerase